MGSTYKKLTIEMLDDCMKQLEEEYKKDNHFVCYMFGNQVQIDAVQNELDRMILEEINKFINKF